MKNKPIFIIANGKIAQDKELRELVSRLRAQNHTMIVRVTWEQGDAEFFVAEAIRRGASKVVAAGGDGTINAVLSGLMHYPSNQRPSLGIIPFGTANDFANFCELPCSSLDECFNLILESNGHLFDVGQVNDMFFINMASGGFSSELTAETSDELKSLIGKAAYFFTGLTQFRNLEPIQVEVEATHFKYQGKILCFSIGLGTMAGGGIKVFTGPPPSGFFNVLIIPSLEEAHTFKLLHELLSKSSSELSEEVYRFQTDRLVIRSTELLQINLDGEPIKGHRFEFKVQQEAIRIHIPSAKCEELTERKSIQYQENDYNDKSAATG